MGEEECVTVEELIDKTLLRIEQIGNDVIEFTCDDGTVYRMRHDQECCESVYVEDIIGDLTDLIGSPIIMAEEATGNEGPIGGDSFTWTFYKLATAKGYVTIRWYGESNGYYSESVDFMRLKGV